MVGAPCVRGTPNKMLITDRFQKTGGAGCRQFGPEPALTDFPASLDMASPEP